MKHNAMPARTAAVEKNLYALMANTARRVRRLRWIVRQVDSVRIQQYPQRAAVSTTVPHDQ